MEIDNVLFQFIDAIGTLYVENWHDESYFDTVKVEKLILMELEIQLIHCLLLYEASVLN